jgi:hypothetical protein
MNFGKIWQKEKTMVTFLLSAVVLSALIFAGYRVNMYLYSQGAVGTSSHSMGQMESVAIESLSIQTTQRMAKRERDEGLRYARMGFALVLGFVTILALGVIIALASVFH